MTGDTDLPFRTVAALVRGHARARPLQTALVDEAGALSWAALDCLMDRIAAALRRDGIVMGDVIAICAASSVRYAALFLGALRGGVVVAPLAPGVTPQSFASMLADSGARLLFFDASAGEAMQGLEAGVRSVSLDGAPAADAASAAFDDWLGSEGAARAEPNAASAAAAATAATAPDPDIAPTAPLNIIYSSGTTGTPKGIVQSHGMRWAHVARGARYSYDARTVTLLATPLYSNTTLVVFFPTIAFGGTVVLMAKFDAARYLELAERHRASHTMLVPVQYQRIMASHAFAAHDLSAFRYKFCTSAPFGAALKADVVARWPGGLVEFYGMTEGGGTCILAAHEEPAKLHTVGRPAEGHDLRLIDEAGRELPAGATGEVVGHSPGMMTGYHRQPAKTAEAEWFDAAGKRFIRTGDIGRFDGDGFLVLVDRRKDMIISGGFNIYPRRPRSGAARAPGGGRCGRRRRAVGALGRNAGGVGRAARRSHGRRRRTARLGQCPPRQDAAPGPPELHRPAAAQRDRQGAQARTARFNVSRAARFNVSRAARFDLARAARFDTFHRSHRPCRLNPPSPPRSAPAASRSRSSGSAP